MSRAEELANRLDEKSKALAELPISIDFIEEDKKFFGDTSAELRRLAQVEADHEALKKAISDAVPVAYHRLIDGPYGDVWTVDSGIAKVKAYRPLYTLEGIRTKP